MIIENDETVLSFLSNTLKKAGYKIIIAQDGKSAVRMAKLEKPNLILSEIMLKDIDGFKLLSEIRNNHSLISTGFIFITAKTERTFYRLAMEKGADDYLSMPITKNELLNAVSSRINRNEAVKNFYYSSLREKNQELLSYEKEMNGEIIERLGLDDQILVDTEERHKLIKIKAIKVISSVGDYSKILTFEGNKYFFRRPMKVWEDILPEENFIRIHRSTIINLDFVDKFEKSSNRIYNVYLNNETKPINMSRRYSLKFKDRFSK